MVSVGANFLESGKCKFVVWAPFLSKVELKIVAPNQGCTPMLKRSNGYWEAVLEDISPETMYFYRLEGDRDRPDPASHFQPEGVHGPSQVVDHGAFTWGDSMWRGVRMSDLIIYELHVGTFSPAGSFDAIIERIDALLDLGITAIELMPVAQFPGERNWGYDGAYPFAVQNSYGGPAGLKRLVNECHERGLAVLLDVVYNHLGPEGNYLWEYGPYFTEKHRTGWGKAINFDDAYRDEVRNFFCENAFYWFEKFHIDGLRLDAIHAIVDTSAQPFLQFLAGRVDEFSQKRQRKHHLIAESNLNDARVIRPKELGGYGIDAQWSDDFHHSLHTLLTSEKDGYYADFGDISHFVKSIREGFVYTGQYSHFRNRSHGNSSKDRPAHQFVVFSQNHDQVGNRIRGERLTSLVSFEALKLAAAAVLLSPYIPLLYMGEEYGEDAPFLYFVSHSDPKLIEAVRHGRKEEFASFNWQGEPPDPQNRQTFARSRIDWGKRESGRHKTLLAFYKHLVEYRKNNPVLSRCDNNDLEVCCDDGKHIVWVRRWRGDQQLAQVLNFSESEQICRAALPSGRWLTSLDSSDGRWGGPGTMLPEHILSGEEFSIRGHSFAVFVKE